MIPIIKTDSIKREELFRTSVTADVEAPVREILRAVADRGDKALYDFTERFDRCRLSSLTVGNGEIESALKRVDPKFLTVLREAADRIRDYHSAQKRSGYRMTNRDGIAVGQRILPLDTVGLYVPGGTAAYPSSVLMNVIPAVVAGCRRVIVTTPPRPDGTVPDEILAAASVAGAETIFKLGGAQAVAAMAFGTESVPRVDKICGPGNAFVAEAKRQVYGRVDIDMIAGPSEILVLADGKSDPRWLAADLLSQAEHDRKATAVLVTDSESLAGAVAAELERQIPLLPRAEIAGASIENNGRIVVTSSFDAAVAIANEIAPEHLEICTDDPFPVLEGIRNAGSVFLGRYCPEALGDYFAGPNHTLPTGGTARFSSPLSVDDFVKKSQFIFAEREPLRTVADKVALFAEKEGLSAHARSMTVRFSGEDQKP